jgi:GxxExxY protein
LVEAQVPIPIVYDGIPLEAGLRIDLLVSKQLIIEVKAVEQMHRVFKAQVLTYLKLTGLRLALLINFNVPLIKDGIERIIL